MKILAVTYSSELSGGANRSLLMVLKNLKDIYRHEIYVIVPSVGRFTEELDREDICWMQADFKCGASPKIKSVRDIERYLKMNYTEYKNAQVAKRVAERIKNDGFDIVYTTEIINNFGAYLSKELNIPNVWHFRSTGENDLFRIGFSQTLKKMDGKIIVISTYLQNYVYDRFHLAHDKVEMIHNGLDLKNIEGSAQNRDNGFHMVLCGRIFETKGQLEALKAVNILRKRGYQDIILHFAGSIPKYSKDKYFGKLQAYIKENNLQDAVVFEGEVTLMNEFRRKMNVELMCSFAEPFGRVTVEGMHSGLVVIGSNTGGTLDIIRDGENGFLYQQGSAYSLADKIELVYNNPELAEEIACRAKKFAACHFTMEENVEKIETVLEECICKENEL